MHYSRYRISDFVDLCSSLMSVATHDLTICQAMADVGYNKQKLEEGQLLFQNFLSLTKEHDALTHKKKQVNLQRNQLHINLKKDYMRVVKIARIAFQDQEVVREKLALDGERDKNMDVWIIQGKSFCQGLLNGTSYLTELQNFGVYAQSVQSLMVLFDELKSLSNIKTSVEDNLRLLTREKKAAMVRFQRWLSDYVKMARIRFDENPEMLSRLRIKPNN